MKYYWHIHHEILMEPSENIVERIEYIKNNKPPKEVEIRLKLLKEVRGIIPEDYKMAGQAYKEAGQAYKEAWQAYNEAWQAYNEAGQAYNEAGQAYNEAGQTRKVEIETLHDLECPNCPWDGHTIFPVN